MMNDIDKINQRLERIELEHLKNIDVSWDMMNRRLHSCEKNDADHEKDIFMLRKRLNELESQLCGAKKKRIDKLEDRIRIIENSIFGDDGIGNLNKVEHKDSNDASETEKQKIKSNEWMLSPISKDSKREPHNPNPNPNIPCGADGTSILNESKPVQLCPSVNQIGVEKNIEEELCAVCTHTKKEHPYYSCKEFVKQKPEPWRPEFKKELQSLINKHCVENDCDMPDFMMAEMICGFIVGVGSHIKANLDWHGCDSVCHPKKK